ncbi:hypothetical protein Tco_0660658 [Tanacetum coccineum]
MLIRCKQAHLVLNWEKCHFMVTEGIVLGHKVSNAGLEVDKAKIDVIAKFPPPTKVKAVRIFDFNEECIKENISFGAVLGQHKKNKKGAENVAVDHLSRLKNPNLEKLRDEDIDDNFPDETLMNFSSNDEEEIPWFADFSNYLVGKFLEKD